MDLASLDLVDLDRFAGGFPHDVFTARSEPSFTAWSMHWSVRKPATNTSSIPMLRST